MESDFEVLCFLHERLAKVHGESELLDYMYAMRRIIASMPQDQRSPEFSSHSLDDLNTRLVAEGRMFDPDKTYPIMTPRGIREMDGKAANAFYRRANRS